MQFSAWTDRKLWAGILLGSLIVMATSQTSCKSGESNPRADGASQSIAAPSPATAPTAAHALHNVHALTPQLISGAAPEGDAAFDELKAMGIKTVISVDGATPDVAAAEARGMRYVHIPITYAEVTIAEQMEIARAVRDLPGPIFIHCHHGKHRSPAATAAVGVALGMVTPEQGVAFMKNAGTAPDYEGLYACVASATVLDAAIIDSAPNLFPSVHKAQGLTATMVAVDQAFEHLGDIRAAGWKTPAAHPDLVPAAEAGMLTDNLRLSAEDLQALALGEDFLARMKRAVDFASKLEEALVANAGSEQLDAAYKAVNASCKDCHAVYRDLRQ